MNQASDAWMDDVGDGAGFDDSEEENLEEEQQKEQATVTMEKNVSKNSSSLGLPMNEASDAWMDDVGDGAGFDDSEEEILEVEEQEEQATETMKKSVTKNSCSLGLPMNQASDAWMDDIGEGAGFDDSE